MTRGHIGCPPKIHPTAYQHCKRMDHLNPRIRGFWHPIGDAMTMSLRVRQIGGGWCGSFRVTSNRRSPKIRLSNFLRCHGHCCHTSAGKADRWFRPQTISLGPLRKYFPRDRVPYRSIRSAIPDCIPAIPWEWQCLPLTIRP